MKKLKIVLQSKIVYLILLLVTLIYFIFYNNTNFISQYTTIDNEEFIVEKITFHDTYQTIYLKGKETIIGYADKNKFPYEVGDVVLISGETKQIENPSLPNIFNYKTYLYHKHIYKIITITKSSFIKESNNNIYKIRKYISSKIDKIKYSGAFIKQLLFLTKDENYYNIKQAGISHLFAISGMHISLLIIFLKKVLFRLNKKLSNIIIFMVLTLYLVILNFPISFFRSLLFILLSTINKKLRLDIKKLNILIITFCIIVLLDPFNIYDLGFIFSFTLSFFLILRKDNNFSYIKKLLTTSMFCSLISFPIIINTCYEINITSLINNIIFIPYMSFILLPLSIITLFFPWLDQILYFFVNTFYNLLNFSNGLQLNIILCKQSFVFIFIYYLSIYLYIVLKKKLFLLITLFLVAIWFVMPFNRENQITFINVHEGDSILLVTNKSVNLIDTGGVYTKDDSKYTFKFTDNLITYLKSIGIRKIDNLILTHGDFDHMGEAINLVEKFKIEKVIFNHGKYNELEQKLIEALKSKNISYYNNIKKLNIKDNELYFLYTQNYENENDDSSVIYANIEGKKILLMADAGIQVEKNIIEKYNIKDIDILKVGHHGSSNSTSKSFVDTINPKISIISVGKNNIYNHPKDTVLNILKSSKIYRTDINNSIQIKLNTNIIRTNCIY